MDNIFDKLGIYDLFGMIVPGIIVTMEYLCLMPKFFGNISKECKSGIAGYFLFFVISYTVGLILHEIGTIFDKKVRYKKEGLPKCNFLKEGVIATNCLEFHSNNKLKDKILETYGLDHLNREVDEQEKAKFLYTYCINYSEINNINSKSDKMQSISEMSRSLYLGSMTCMCFYLIYGMHFKLTSIDFLYFFKNIILAIIVVIFWIRSDRYLKYRVRSLIMTCFISIFERE